MHDSITVEKTGIPAVSVMTSNFVSAAELMGNVLGIPGYEFAVIEHPVSSASQAGLQSRAQATVDSLQRILLAK